MAQARKAGLERYVALLRGINLGARNKIAMADLRELFASLGAEDVTTYVQSGNVVFGMRAGHAGLAARIEQQIAQHLALDIRVMVRTRAELARLVSGNPFAENDADPLRLHVTFLAAKPAAARARALDETAFEPDRFRVVGAHVYLHTPDGYGRSKLSNAFFEKQLGVAATTRNWRTVTALAELARGSES
jgi:uncharacterized protein (DUF1697 family)